jgi:hypothetical protein
MTDQKQTTGRDVAEQTGLRPAEVRHIRWAVGVGITTPEIVAQRLDLHIATVQFILAGAREHGHPA